jgi:exopolysaccharide biosynthesis polyprenyl glycosylphosphotransferase
MLREQVKLITYSIRILDLVLTAGCFLAAYLIRTSGLLDGIPSLTNLKSIGPLHQYYWALFIMIPVWAVLLYGFGMYDSMRTKTYWAVAWVVIKSSVLGFILLSVLMYFLERDFPRSILGIFLFLNLVVLLAEKILIRFLQRFFRARGFNYRTIIIVGTSRRALRFARMLEEHAGWGLKFAGFVEGLDEETPAPGLPVLGKIKDLIKIIDENVIDEVFFAVPVEKIQGIQDAIWACEEVGVKIHVNADFFNLLLSRTKVENFHGVPILTSSSAPDKAFPLLLKRLADTLIAFVSLVILTPLFTFVALLIKATSKGPVFFIQVRAGLNGRTFNLFKFRTMRQDAEKLRNHLEELNEMQGPVFKIKNDPRITFIGRILRKFSIDELPQLWNVLKGDMSLVGPRPLPVYEVERFEERWQRRRLSMKPGLTCLWQVNGRNKITDFNEWMELDLKYIDNWSLGLDFKVLVKTIPTVIFARGAS